VLEKAVRIFSLLSKQMALTELVQRGKAKSMRKYEVMVILDPELEEKTVNPSLETFLNVVRQDGGQVNKVDICGRRRLAFEINKKTEGIYAILDITSSAFAVSELDRQLNLNESVMRTKVVRPEARSAK
jgi:small subunit ribosomal protein S6